MDSCLKLTLTLKVTLSFAYEPQNIVSVLLDLPIELFRFDFYAIQTSTTYPILSGTDATHAEHIETIKSRQYVGVQNDGTFLPGTLGMGLVEGLWN